MKANKLKEINGEKRFTIKLTNKGGNFFEYQKTTGTKTKIKNIA